MAPKLCNLRGNKFFSEIELGMEIKDYNEALLQLNNFSVPTLHDKGIFRVKGQAFHYCKLWREKEMPRALHLADSVRTPVWREIEYFFQTFNFGNQCFSKFVEIFPYDLVPERARFNKPRECRGWF